MLNNQHLEKIIEEFQHQLKDMQDMSMTGFPGLEDKIEFTEELIERAKAQLKESYEK